MICPLCKKEKTQKHLSFCKDNIKNIPLIDLKVMFLEYNYPDIFEYNKLYKIYIEDEMSLPEITRVYGIYYNTILFMLKYYNIPIRNKLQCIENSKSKREKTNIERYGAKNVLSKGTIKYEKRNNTIKDRYGVDNVFQIPEIIEKINNDSYYLKKYNMTKSQFKSKTAFTFWNSMNYEDRIKFVERCNTERKKTFNEIYGQHPIKDSVLKEKRKSHNLIKYETEYYFQSYEFLNNEEIKQKAKNTRIKNGYMLSDIDIEPFLLYKRNCRRITYKFRKQLFENWDGNDFYDGEYIKDNLNMKNINPNYPTIDHKISIFYGFVNGIKEEEIGDITNLCITKRRINCSKRSKNNYYVKSKNK